MGIYQNLYALIEQYIYGGATLTPDMELTATIIATAGAVFVVALPFCLVWRVCRMLCGH